LNEFWAGVIASYHGPGRVVRAHPANDTTSWNLNGVEKGQEGLDVTLIGQKALPVRLRVSRNFAQVNLPAGMEKEERILLESVMCDRFSALKDDPEFAGRYYSLTPGHPDQMSEDMYLALVNEQLVFKPLSKKRLLVSAGIAGDWPIGRGAYISTNRKYCVWVGEEDHIRLTVQMQTTDLAAPFNNLKRLLDSLDSPSPHGFKYAKSKQYGFITSSPDRLGTTLFATIQLALPDFTPEHEKKAKSLLQMIGLALESVGLPGNYELTVVRRLGLTERHIVKNIWTGLRTVLKIDTAPAAP